MGPQLSWITEILSWKWGFRTHKSNIFEFYEKILVIFWISVWSRVDQVSCSDCREKIFSPKISDAHIPMGVSIFYRWNSETYVHTSICPLGLIPNMYINPFLSYVNLHLTASWRTSYFKGCNLTYKGLQERC